MSTGLTPLISRASAASSYAEARREVAIANSDGLFTGDDRTRTRQFWQGRSTPGSAQAVGVTAGWVTAGIDASMVAGAVGGHEGQSLLSVGFAGAGSGTVSSSPAGISCGSVCSHLFDIGASVTLTAVPASGSTFAGWSGACIGRGPCPVSLESDSLVVASFDLVSGGGGGGKGGDGPPAGAPPSPARDRSVPQVDQGA